VFVVSFEIVLKLFTNEVWMMRHTCRLTLYWFIFRTVPAWICCFRLGHWQHIFYWLWSKAYWCMHEQWYIVYYSGQ